MRHIAAVIAILVLGATLAHAGREGERDQFDPAKRTLIAKEQVDAEVAASKKPVQFEGAWTPSDDDLAELEATLAPLLIAEIERNSEAGDRPLFVHDYYRQYVGVLKADKRFIFVNGLHTRDLELATKYEPDPDIWKRQFIVRAPQAGCRSFIAIYDADVRAFVGDFRCPKNIFRSLNAKPSPK